MKPQSDFQTALNEHLFREEDGSEAQEMGAQPVKPIGPWEPQVTREPSSLKVGARYAAMTQRARKIERDLKQWSGMVLQMLYQAPQDVQDRVMKHIYDSFDEIADEEVLQTYDFETNPSWEGPASDLK